MIHKLNAKGHLLIVEDESDLREVLKEETLHAGFNSIAVGNGKEALAMLLEPKPHQAIDAVLTDINMPIMDGLQLLDAARTRALATPFIFLTGFGDKKKAIQALKLGAIDFQEKPFKLPELIQAISSAMALGLSLRETEQEVEQTIIDFKIPEALKEDFRRRQRAILSFRNGHLRVRKW